MTTERVEEIRRQHRFHNCDVILDDAQQVREGSSWWGKSWNWLEERLRCALDTRVVLRAALAQAERERDYLKTRVISVANFDEMQRERDAARAEVERLKGLLPKDVTYNARLVQRAEQAEADLTRLLAALEQIVGSSGAAARDIARAALEGQK